VRISQFGGLRQMNGPANELVEETALGAIDMIQRWLRSLPIASVTALSTAFTA